MSDALQPDIRSGSITQINLDPDIFPFDAFEFDDPNRTLEPDLKLKEPWAFDGQTIRAESITVEKLTVGVKGTAYSQPLAPNLVFIADTWIDSDDGQFHIPYGGEIDTSVGGAGADVTEFEEDIGGAGADVSSFDAILGNIPAYAGWIQSAYVPGTTLIDGGMIETDTLKSANYVPGVSGSKFDLASGYIETGDGIYRGTLGANEVSTGGIYSPDYIPGETGWNVDSDGSAEFSDIDIRGIANLQQIEVGNISIGTIIMKASREPLTSDNSDIYSKYFEIAAAGTVRLEFEGKWVGSVISHIIVNQITAAGVETQIDLFYPTTSYVVYTYDFTIAEGDRIQVEPGISGAGAGAGTAFVQNAYIKIAQEPGILTWLGYTGDINSANPPRRDR